MLYRILKIPARIALLIYCKKLHINRKDFLRSKGPLLIAANHPNSFLDAVLVTALFNQPVYSLARGDVFINKFIRLLLRSINILPVYRISEGAENLNQNYSTFEQCREIFRKNGIVLIFSEGLCLNEWKLRPLKKGTARLAFSSWEDGIDLTVLPLGINYDSFNSFGKSIILNAGKSFNWDDFDRKKLNGHSISEFNDKLREELLPLVEHIDKGDTKKIAERFSTQTSSAKKRLLFLPAFFGKWIHYPFYSPIKKIVWSKAKKSVHFDSILIGLVFLIYPLVLLTTSVIVYTILGNFWYSLLPLIALPFVAWAYIQVKK